jgi:hypothetical protein
MLRLKVSAGQSTLVILGTVGVDLVELRQVLTVWDIVPLEQHESAGAKISERLRRLPAWQRACHAVRHEDMDGLVVPRCWATLDEMKLLDGGAVTGAEGGEDLAPVEAGGSAAEYSKLHRLDPAALRALLQCGTSYVDIPLKLTPVQEQVVAGHFSTIVIGRSGTGKTTVMIMRLRYEALKHERALVQEASEGEAAGGAGEAAGGNPEEGRPALNQLMLTASKRLACKMRQHYGKLRRADQPFVEEGPDGNGADSYSMQELQDDHQVGLHPSLPSLAGSVR